MIEFRKIYDRLRAEVKTANDGKTAITILPTVHAEQVLEMMKRQEPVKVKDCANIVDGIQVGYCPKCDRKIVWNSEKEETIAFCKYCGQAVKWDQE